MVSGSAAAQTKDSPANWVSVRPVTAVRSCLSWADEASARYAEIVERDEHRLPRELRRARTDPEARKRVGLEQPGATELVPAALAEHVAEDPALLAPDAIRA